MSEIRKCILLSEHADFNGRLKQASWQASEISTLFAEKEKVDGGKSENLKMYLLTCLLTYCSLGVLTSAKPHMANLPGKFLCKSVLLSQNRLTLTKLTLFGSLNRQFLPLSNFAVLIRTRFFFFFYKTQPRSLRLGGSRGLAETKKS